MWIAGPSYSIGYPKLVGIHSSMERIGRYSPSDGACLFGINPVLDYPPSQLTY